MNQLFQMKK